MEAWRKQLLDNPPGWNWKVTSPDGNTVTVRNLKKWCSEMGVSYSLARCGQYKGYTAIKI